MNGKPKLLLVDDEPNLLLLMTRTLASEGYEIVTAADGCEGLAKAGACRPDMVLLDMELPDINGLEVCRRIKSDPDLEGILVIIVSGIWTAADHQNRGLRAGADGYITRPFQKEDFLARVEAFGRVALAEKRLRETNRFLEQQVAERTAELSETLAQLREEITKLRSAESALRTSEARIEHLNDVLRAIRDVSRLLNHEEDPLKLLNAVCNTLVQTRGYVMVWIGQPETGSNRILPVAYSGSGSRFLHHAPITWDDSPSGRGPAGTAMRERRLVVFDDLANDPRFALWKEQVTAYGGASIASLPLIYRDRLFGVLTVKADRQRAFDAEETDLLSGLAADLARKLQGLEDEAARKKAEEVLRQAHSELEQRVQERTKELRLEIAERKRAEEELRLAKEVAEAANRAKSVFLAHMSHEIRTPLNAVLGFSQLLQKDPALTPRQKEHIGLINRSGEHLLRIINDVLEMSKIEAGRARLHPDTFDLHALLEESETMFRAHAEEKGLFLELNRTEPLPRYLHGDSGKIGQVLMNMLGNAFKFTETGGITVRVKSERVPAALRETPLLADPCQEIPPDPPLQKGGAQVNPPLVKGTAEESPSLTKGGAQVSPPLVKGNLGGFSESLPRASTDGAPVRVIIEVTDTGPGIASDELTRVFEPFEQTQSGEYQGRGTGLGMPISRRYARMMGGDLTVTSEVGKGCSFCYTFQSEVVPAPWFQAKEVPQSQGPARLKPGRPVPKVLVVDDNDANREVLRLLLEGVGFEVRSAIDGPEAIAIAEAWHPAIILLDRRMPKMDGLDVTRAIKASSWGQGIRIVIVSAGVFELDEQECVQSGADGFIAKPYKDDELIAVIAGFLDIDLVYEEAGEVVDPSTETLKQALAQLPAELCTALIEATEAGDVSGLLELIGKRVAPLEPPLAEKLRRLVETYDYGTILQILNGGDHG